jgi:hypothetical protein
MRNDTLLTNRAEASPAPTLVASPAVSYRVGAGLASALEIRAYVKLKLSANLLVGGQIRVDVLGICGRK